MAARGSDSETLSISLPDGCTLSYGIYGATAPSSLTVFYFHGFPASHHEAAVLDDAAWAADIRVVAPSRPSMCRSTFQPDRAIAHWPTDVLALADHAAIRADTFGVLGASDGSPYVLACCATLPASRLRAAGILGLVPCVARPAGHAAGGAAAAVAGAVAGAVVGGVGSEDAGLEHRGGGGDIG